MTDGTNTWYYTYNVDGLRTNRNHGATSYDYIYNGDKLTQMDVKTLFGSYDGTSIYNLSFTYDVNGIPLTVTCDTNTTDITPGTYYYVTNIQGDVVGILDGSGNKVVSYLYDAWGNILETSGTMASTLGFYNPLRYRSYVYDQETNLYYLQSRYYDPEVGRFLNADNYPSTGQGLLGNNMFAYCNNNPIIKVDRDGCAAETVWDVISLAASIAEVAINPADPWAWAGLIGDVVDVCIPFVGGIGEAVDAVKLVKGVVKNTDNVVDAAKTVKPLVSNATGSYEVIYKSGKNYVGKGPFSRAIKSAKEHARPNALNDMLGDEVVSITWKRAANDRDAFRAEYLMQKKRSVLSADKNALTYNKIWSPGGRYAP